jgi:hypothetical protein
LSSGIVITREARNLLSQALGMRLGKADPSRPKGHL